MYSWPLVIKKNETVQLAFEVLGLHDSALLHVCLSIQKVGTKSKVQKIVSPTYVGDIVQMSLYECICEILSYWNIQEMIFIYFFSPCITLC